MYIWIFRKRKNVRLFCFGNRRYVYSPAVRPPVLLYVYITSMSEQQFKDSPCSLKCFSRSSCDKFIWVCGASGVTVCSGFDREHLYERKIRLKTGEKTSTNCWKLGKIMKGTVTTSKLVHLEGMMAHSYTKNSSYYSHAHILKVCHIFLMTTPALRIHF